MERQLERCGGLDVHKETVAACVRVGGRTGKAEQHVQTFGTTVGEHWLGQLTWNHVNGVELQGPLGLNTPGTTADDQYSIDDLNTYDAYIQYDFLGSGLTEDLSFSLGVTNLTDEDPQLLKRTNGQSAGFGRPVSSV